MLIVISLIEGYIWKRKREFALVNFDLFYIKLKKLQQLDY